MTDKPTTRKDLMKPVQLLGLAFIAALFAGFVTLMSMGFFQTRPADQIQRALVVAAVAAGATFIVVLVSVALMLLAVDPSKVTSTVDRPLLLPKDDQDAATPAASRSGASAPAASDPPSEAPRAGGAAADDAPRPDGSVPPRPRGDGTAPGA